MRPAFAGMLVWVACAPSPAPVIHPDASAALSDPVDPLSMPATASLASAEFHGAETCAPCHPSHAAEWRRSSHAYAMRDPLFRALVAIRQQDFQGERDAFCTQCHSAIGTRAREVVPQFRFADLSQIASEGVGCEACHKISGLVRTYNAGHTLDPSGPLRGPIRDPVETSAHASAESADFERSELCASCHDVLEYSGLPLERPFEEWLASPAGAEGRSCQSCHMRARPGIAAEGGPERVVHDHRFVGVDVPLEDGVLSEAERAEAEAAVDALLRDQARLTLRVPSASHVGTTLDVVVSVENLIDAHSFPTGTTFHRQLWIELLVTDATGRQLYATGTLDDDGDLRDHFSALDPYGDADLLRFGTKLLDARGNPTLFPWRAAEAQSTMIPAAYTRTYTLLVSTSSAAAGTAEIRARLRFRALPPFLLRALGLGDGVSRLAIHEVATASTTVELLR